MKRIKFFSTIIALTVCTSLVQGVSTYAEDTTVQEIMNKSEDNKAHESVINKRQEDLDFLVKELKEKHPNIFHKNNEEVFKQKAEEIKNNLSKMSDVEFSIAISEYVALAEDSHTKAAIGKALGDKVHILPIGVKK